MLTREELARLGAEMREAQKAYFKARDMSKLEASKALERRFDAEVKRLLTHPQFEFGED